MTGPWNNKTLFHPLQLPWEPGTCKHFPGGADQLHNRFTYFPLPSTRGKLLGARHLIRLGSPVLAKCLNHKSQLEFLHQGWDEKHRGSG